MLIEQNGIQEKKASKKVKMLKVNITSNEGDKVAVKIPWMIAKLALKGKGKITIGNDKAESALKAVDFEELYEMIENNEIGELVNIESAKGDHIRVFIE